MKRLFFLAVPALLVPSPASATIHKGAALALSDGPSASVAVDDLNLDSASGRATLVRRIRSAADHLCREYNVDPLDTRLKRLDCYRVAVRSGDEQMRTLTVR
ncbi:UrcA family protein [Sphingomonas sp.]|uniref:UrcA family protein n=1 Tax=Sphingomonas sp. TaxID=28214 RepID=UPI0038B1003E